MTQVEKFEANEKREELFRDALYLCEHCGRSVNRYGTPQLAHRIAKTKANIKRYGESIIHHKLNLAPTCSLECNSAMYIGVSRALADMLAEKIREAINEE
jgi:hypothetical protein